MNTAAIIFYSVLCPALSYGFWRQRKHFNQQAQASAAHHAAIKRALQAELEAIIEDYHCDKWDQEMSKP